LPRSGAGDSNALSLGLDLLLDLQMTTVYNSLPDVELTDSEFISPPAVGPESVLHGKLANGMT
jgi:hypothetical protein